MTTDDQGTKKRVGEAQSGTARAAVLGVSDGLVTNVSMILGVAGANADASFVRLAGLASLVAGACSMAVGEYISMQAQRELLEKVLADARAEMDRDPQSVIARLVAVYEREGFDAAAARGTAEKVASDPARCVEEYVQEVHGFTKEGLGSPVAAAFSSLVMFAVGAMVPLVPWYIWTGDQASIASIVLAAIGAFAIGAYLGKQTGRGVWFSAIRQVAIVALAAGITYLVGRIFRVKVA